MGERGKMMVSSAVSYRKISRINRNSNEDFGQRHEAYKESSRANKFLVMKNLFLGGSKSLSHLLV